MDEFTLPIDEGLFPMDPIKVQRYYSSDELPIEVGGLEKKDFTSLADWLVAMGEDGYGFAYRIGIKTNVQDKRKERSDLLIIFGVPLSKKKDALDEKTVKRIYSTIRNLMQESTLKLSYSFKNLMGACLPPPDYMYRELQEVLKPRK